MNTERLFRLIKILEGADRAPGPRAKALLARQAPQAPTSGFDMGHWIHRDECGTSACAIGLAALDARCQAEGLRLYGRNEKSGEYNIWLENIEKFNRAVESYPPSKLGFGFINFPIQPKYQGWTGFHAAAKWADISTREAQWLFDPEQYGPEDEDEDQDTRAITPSMVIERIRQLVAKDRKGE